jgi:hypothetical protein
VIDEAAALDSQTRNRIGAFPEMRESRIVQFHVGRGPMFYFQRTYTTTVSGTNKALAARQLSFRVQL